MACQMGFDGKLPSRADFVNRGLPQGFTLPWQSWLDRCLQTIGQRPGAAWDTIWPTIPVCHFSLAAGQAGPWAVAGLVLPSADKVGRFYPLTVAAIFPAARTAMDWRIDETWHHHAEAAALTALEVRQDPDTLAAVITALTPPSPDGLSPAGTRWWTTERSGRQPQNWIFGTMPTAAEFDRMISWKP